MAPQKSGLDRTFVNLTDDPAEGRGARRTYIRRAVMKSYHERRSQKKRASKSEGDVAEKRAEKHLAALMASIDKQMAPQSYALIPKFILFERIKFSEPPMAQISCLILRYLCGQVSKASHDLSFVGFIHHTTSQNELKDNSENMVMNHNTLRTSLNVLQSCNYSNNLPGLAADNESLWKLIHQHQEWIYSRITTFSQWELLSAAQATTIYLLLRVKQGRNSLAFPNGDIALLFTLGAIFRHLHKTTLLDSRPRQDFRQWVFFESFTRIACIYFTLSAVVSTNFGLPCDDPKDWNFGSMLVPATKVSWVAANASDWMSVLPPEKELTWRDLVSAASLDGSPVETWKESSDELGMVVMMTMTLISQQPQYLIPSPTV
ncbi:hypothetical protein LI328DRAFT_168553 [Trichoderma asperelloides]|nr:hypothetical protein LI328DRAFT_168553 [Trichoderma asperelloides]